MYINDGKVTLTDRSTVHTNRATGTGGGIHRAGGNLTGAIAGRNVYDNTPNNITR